MLPNMMRWIATLLTVSLIACHSPLAWSGEIRRAPPTAPQQTSVTSASPSTAGSSERTLGDQKLSDQRRAELAEREKANGTAETYSGGDGVYIGGGVLLVALIIVAVIVIVD